MIVHLACEGSSEGTSPLSFSLSVRLLILPVLIPHFEDSSTVDTVLRRDTITTPCTRDCPTRRFSRRFRRAPFLV